MDITIVTVAAVVTNGFLLFGMFGLWLRHRARRVEDAARVSQADQIERLAADVRALRATLDAVAIEVERVGEGQRYAARLLGERSDAGPARGPSPARVITPH